MLLVMALSPDSDEIKFYKLFWKAREEHYKNQEGPKHAACLQLCRELGWTWGEELLQASRKIYSGSKETEEAMAQLEEIKAPPFAQGLVDHFKGRYYHEKKDFTQALDAYKKALDDPNYEVRGYTWNNIGTVLSDKADFDGALDAYHKALADPNYDTPGNAWYNIGVALFHKGDIEGSIKACHKALADPNYDTLGDTWYNIGVALFQKGECDEAIEAYRKALDDPNYNTPGNTWNNLGVALSQKGNIDDAIEAYHKALDDPNYDTPGNAWYNLGNILLQKADFDDAIDSYHKALASENYEDMGLTWNNLGSAYKKKGDIESAKAAYRKVLTLEQLDPVQKKRAELELSVLEQNIREEALSPNDRALIQDSDKLQPFATRLPTEQSKTPEERIRAKRAGSSTKYDEYIARFDPKKATNNCLNILRGWSSAITLLEGGDGKWRGGGYFLIWRGFGIIIDPGFDFLRNFHDAGFHALQIHAVIVSHNHPDHNNDIKPIDDLIYEAFWRKHRGPYAIFPDLDTQKSVVYTVEKPEHREETELHYDECRDNTFNFAIRKGVALPARLTIFPAEHDKTVPHALGMVLELCDENQKTVFRIGYTGDTGYYPDLAQKLDNCDIIIVHISEPSEDELKADIPPRKIHLGYRGVIKLLQEIKKKPSLILIGEFWAGLEDTRIEIIQGLRERTGLKNIYPACLGMRIDLQKPFPIVCTKCGKASESVSVAPPKDSYGDLAYLCPSCIIPVL